MVNRWLGGFLGSNKIVCGGGGGGWGSEVWRSTGIAINPSDTNGVSVRACRICVYIGLCMNEQKECACVVQGLQKEELPLSLCDGAMLQICLIAITPPSIHTGTCYHSSLLLRAIRETFTAPYLASFFPYEQASLCHGTLR